MKRKLALLLAMISILGAVLTGCTDAHSSGGRQDGESAVAQVQISAPVQQTAEEEADSDTAEEMVWIPRWGEKYHTNARCSNMKNPAEVTIAQAISRGYTPCKNCYG